MKITRNYTHRTYGAIGAVEFETPKGKYILNGHELPESSVEHLMTFALQTLQDAYAGSKNTDESLGAFNGKLDKLLNGTIGTRGGGDGADERTRVGRSIMQGLIKDKYGAKSPEYAAFTGLDDDARNAKLDELLAKNQGAVKLAIDEEMERRAAKRAAKAALSGSVDIAI